VRHRRRQAGRDARSCSPPPKANPRADFNLLGLRDNDGTACVALCVHGRSPASSASMPAPTAWGPGNRANASIGRALQLVIRNIGGARSDSATWRPWASPGKYTLCFAERNDGPFPTLTERPGLGSGRDAITVMGISGTAEVLPGDGEGATPEAILSPIVAGMKAALVMSSMSRRNERGEQVFLLPLEMAEKIVRHDGWTSAACSASCSSRATASRARRRPSIRSSPAAPATR
jgi:hypothetical protein